MTHQAAARVADVPPGTAVRVELDAADGSLVEVAVVCADDGSIHAISDVCSHGQVSLSEGEIEGCTVECWLHGSVFDLRTGQPLGLPATRPVPVYPVTIDGEEILVDVDNQGEN
ncbi:Rieske (2Fe-2S) domain protein [Beutenbergia cavernae DSM 12333]|uniref:Rieske (2Fe-2S) domain protein n=1 Tax=Beutenbergia cavernae (strain ATCC BAA-8 / DSM 12333 / CCUG 43141 / JCM 11478 / NBRC 16432 / NCIMB 13614 / HKI 0122) TaxID=471853 RepID=C5BVY8_BEUC1|nr:non-heme iron oxygenase ferredoxin subunit [Beutenbergia cavernae]ACQ80589.1 Rieske (2Fe-2S) domain protein [Beutenbergia cavernae DSM 12333]